MFLGYKGSGRRCTNINECANSALNDCHYNATCNDNDGSYSCACRGGYVGNGTFCEEYKECEHADVLPCVELATCMQRGSDEVPTFSCDCANGYQG